MFKVGDVLVKKTKHGRRVVRATGASTFGDLIVEMPNGVRGLLTATDFAPDIGWKPVATVKEARKLWAAEVFATRVEGGAGGA